MKQPTEQELRIVYGGLIDNPHLVYSRFVNVTPVKPPYSKTLRPNRFYLETRAGWRDRMNSVIISVKNDDCVQLYSDNYTGEQYNKTFFGRFTDVITIVETINGEQIPFEYWMWVSQDKLTIKIFKSQDGCHLMEIISDCFCICGAEYFIPINFLKGKPRSLFKDSTGAIQTIAGSEFDGYCGLQTNYTFYQERASLADMSSDAVDGSSVLWNFGNGVNAIQPGDYLYAYSLDRGCTTKRSGICGQVNTVTGINTTDNTKLMVSNYWNGFEPGQIDATKWQDVNGYFNIYGTIDGLDQSYYVPGREPQTEGYNMDYMVFPEYGETFAYQYCGGLKAYHYHDYYDNCNNAITTVFCNFEGCFTDTTMYTGRNGVSHLVTLDNTHSVILYSDGGNLAYLGAGNTVPVRKNTLGMASFQNYVVYFGKDHIGAFYIDLEQDRLVGTNRYVAKGNIIRNNLGFRVNPNGRVDAYDEYDNSFYFLGSNKRLYALSIAPSDTGILMSQLEDMTDNEWARWIIGDLDNIDESDYVYIQADNDRFRIFINGSTTNNGVANKTKILTYWKRYKFWTTDISCDAVVSKEVSGLCGKYLLGKKVYDECGDFDGQGSPVEYMIEAHIGEDEATRIEGNHSFNLKYLDYIKTQIGKTSRRVLGDSRLDIYGYKNGLQFKKTILDVFDNPYLKILEDVRKGETITPSKCMIQDLSDCEYFFEECKGDTTIQHDTELANIPRDDNELIKLCNGYDYRSCFSQCACPKEKKIDDYCFCFDDKKYHISPFINLLTNLDMKAEMYTVQLRGHDKISFGGFFMGLYNGNSPKEVNECAKLDCQGCNDTVTNLDNNNRCF